MSGANRPVVLSEYAREYVADPVLARKRSIQLRKAEEEKFGTKELFLLAAKSRLRAHRLEAALASSAEGTGTE